MKYFLIISAFLLSTQGWSQNSGLYGKKTFIELNGLGSIPMFGWFLNETGPIYKANGKSLTQGNDNFNYGFRVTLGRVLKRNTALSLELGYDYRNVSGPEYVTTKYLDQWGYYSEQYVQLKHEMFDVSTFSIMPKIEWTKSGGLLPIGLNHQIGIGYSSAKIQEKDYIYRITSGAEYLSASDSANFSEKLVDYDQRYKGFSLMYAFNIRKPITKSLMINYGIRYTLNLRQYGQTFSGSSNYLMDHSEAAQKIGRTQLTNFMTFNLGVSYAF